MELEDLMFEETRLEGLLDEAITDEEEAANRVATYSEELDEIRENIREMEKE